VSDLKINKISPLNRNSQRRLNFFLFLFKASTGRFNVIYYLLPFLAFLFLLHRYITTRYEHLVPPLLHYIQPALFTFVAVTVITPIVMKISRSLNFIEQPSYPKAHKFPVTYLGGFVLYLVFLIIAFFYRPWTAQLQAILWGAGLIVLVGTIDDLHPLSSTIRLIAQIAAASIVMSSGLLVSFLPKTLWGDGLAIAITLLWIIGIINATNFFDGADGLAAGFSVIAASFFFLIALHLQQYNVAIVSALLIGSGLGFLVFNFYPAKIILGDGGSTFLGFLLACLALYGGWSSWGSIIALGIPVLILGVLIFDVIYITISRIKNGHVKNFRQWLDYRARDHFHHRLMNLGLKEREAVIFIYIISIVLGLSALVIEHARVSYPVVILLLQATLIFSIITILMLAGRQFSDK